MCFCCEEKYIVGYRCKSKELRVLLVHNSEAEIEMEVNSKTTKIVAMQAVEVGNATKLSLNTVVYIREDEIT